MQKNVSWELCMSSVKNCTVQFRKCVSFNQRYQQKQAAARKDHPLRPPNTGELSNKIRVPWATRHVREEINMQGTEKHRLCWQTQEKFPAHFHIATC